MVTDKVKIAKINSYFLIAIPNLKIKVSANY